MTPLEQQRHAWFQAWLTTEGGGQESSPWINGDAHINRWMRMTIEIAADRRVQFLADDKVIWASTKKLHPGVVAGRNVVIGLRSSGSAGKSYHDSVTVWR